MHMPLRRHAKSLYLIKTTACLAALCFLGPSIFVRSTMAQAAYPDYGLIDFEGFSEFTPISDQYANLGVFFSLAEYPTLFPIIASVGPPTVAFTNPAGASDPSMFDGLNGLTDPLVDGDWRIGYDIQVDFNPPVRWVSLYLRNIGQANNSPETIVWKIRRSDGSISFANCPIQYSTVNLNAQALLDQSPINQITIMPRAGGNCSDNNNSPSSPVDFAIDTILFTRSSEASASVIRVEQESVPGAGDFSQNQLGYIKPFFGVPDHEESPSRLYRYNEDVAGNQGRKRSFGLQFFQTMPNRSHVFFATTSSGLSMFIVHGTSPELRQGAGANMSSGRAEMLVEVAGPCEIHNPFIDDDDDVYVLQKCNQMSVIWNWPMLETDGLSLSGFGANNQIMLSFADVDGSSNTPTAQGLTDWLVVSSDRIDVPIALEEGRRVRLSIVARCESDFDNSIIVTVADLFGFLDAWFIQFGQAGPGLLSADFDHDGVVDVGDLFDYLDTWFTEFGACGL